MSKEKRNGVNKRDEFRISDKAKGHLSYVFGKKKDQLAFLSMTHKPPKEKKDKFIKLTHSVDPKDGKSSYINTEADRDHFSKFGPKKKGFFFATEDKKIVKKIIRKNKKSEK